MKKAFLLVVVLFVSVISTACINNFAVQELNSKAKSYLDSGDYENAISRLKSSIDLDSTIFETHYNLGIAYTQAEKYPEAVKTFQSAIKLRPSFADTYYSLAVAQENFARGIIEGSITSDGKSTKDEKQKNDNEDENSSPKAKIKLSDADNAKIAELFDGAINSYSTYIEKGDNVEDKSEVEEKIEKLKTEILKYSANNTESVQ